MSEAPTNSTGEALDHAAAPARHLSMVPDIRSGDLTACDVEGSKPMVAAPLARPASVRIARACESYASQMRYHSVTLADLCRVAGASERRIRHAFIECHGVPPTAFLRSAALDQVRRVLLKGPSSRDVVSRAATDFGFHHLSRFAEQYRALFGELPSTTVARRTESAVRLPERGHSDQAERARIDSGLDVDPENEVVYLDAG